MANVTPDDILIESRSSPVRLRNRESEQTIRLLVSVRPSESLRASIPRSSGGGSGGADVCLTLDVSHSMSEVIGEAGARTGEIVTVEGRQCEVVTSGTTKLQACVAAARPLLGLLRPQDTLSLVTFGDDARIVCGPLTRGQTADYERALQSLVAGGLTALGKGIQTATQALTSSRPERMKKIILMTDGNPQGEPLTAALQQGQAAADCGMNLDCLGFGNDFNLRFMQEVVTPSRGRSDLIRTQSDAEELFSTMLKKAQDVVATNLRLRLMVSQQVRVTDHYRGAPENLYLGKVSLPDAARECVMPLGGLERDQRYDYYFLVTVPQQPGHQGEFRLMKAELTYDVPALGRMGQSLAKNIVINFVADQRQPDAHDSIVEKGFTLTEIKRLERECEEARSRNNQLVAVERFLDIIQRYDQLGMAAEKKEVQEALEQYKKTGNISQDLLNRAARSSSKAADSGELAKTLDAKKRAAIFG